MARGGDWVPCRQYGDPIPYGAGNPANIILVRSGTGVLAIPEESVIESPDDIVVERVIGQFELSSEEEVPVLACLRVRVAIYDDLNDQVAFYADSLFTGTGANEPFLWQRYLRPSPDAFGGLQQVDHPWWTSVDIRVKRRLGRDQALVLSVETGGALHTIRPFLRSWARGSAHS